LLAEIAKQLPENGLAPTLLIFTDGGIDHADDPAMLHQACKRLARRGLRLRVLGIDPAARPLWEQTTRSTGIDFAAVPPSEIEGALRDLGL
jgi:uncharacterized protein with von Willebrand factor type A (vWA) domain